MNTEVRRREINLCATFIERNGKTIRKPWFKTQDQEFSEDCVETEEDSNAFELKGGGNTKNTDYMVIKKKRECRIIESNFKIHCQIVLIKSSFFGKIVNKRFYIDIDDVLPLLLSLYQTLKSITIFRKNRLKIHRLSSFGLKPIFHLYRGRTECVTNFQNVQCQTKKQTNYSILFKYLPYFFHTYIYTYTHLDIR